MSWLRKTAVTTVTFLSVTLTDNHISVWGEQISRVVGGSTVGKMIDSLGESTLISGLEAVGDNAARIARQSFLFQWLTKEPEPEVIVIDLRETRTVGPVIGLLDWSTARVRPYWEETTLKTGMEHLVALGERAADTRVGSMLVRLLTPPEPPEDEPREDA